MQRGWVEREAAGRARMATDNATTAMMRKQHTMMLEAHRLGLPPLKFDAAGELVVEGVLALSLEPLPATPTLAAPTAAPFLLPHEVPKRETKVVAPPAKPKARRAGGPVVDGFLEE